MESSSAPNSNNIEQTLKTASANEESRGANNSKNHHQTQEGMEKHGQASSELLEPSHLREETIVLQRCPSVNGIFCESVNAITEILSLDGTEADEESLDHHQKTPVGRRDSPTETIPACLTPSNEHNHHHQGCQRRGRFLIWPASLSAPSLALPDTRGA